MTPEQKIKRHILAQAVNEEDFAIEDGTVIDAGNIDELYDQLVETDAHWEYESEFRNSGEETNIPAPDSRHYESESRARKLIDGTWVGWTYWYGGGKHGEPESVDWMGPAYELNVTEEEKVVVVRTFEKK